MLRKVTTQYGTIEGVPCGDPRITVFKGVPYAKPPVGELRWRAPQPPRTWCGWCFSSWPRFCSLCITLLQMRTAHSR